jgi:hypothetical protein
MRLANKRLLINDRMTPREKVAVLVLSMLAASSTTENTALKVAVAECELVIKPVLDRFRANGAAVYEALPSEGLDSEALGLARLAIGDALVMGMLEISDQQTDPYMRIAGAEWLIWAETERRRVMPKGRGRPRKAAIV